MAATFLSVSIRSPSTPLSSVLRPARRSSPIRRLCSLSSSASSSPHSRSHGEGIPNAPRSTAARDGTYLGAEVDPDSRFGHKLTVDPSGNALLSPAPTTESTVERVIFDFRFLALLAVGGSLAGSILCFLNGCVYIVDAYKIYWTSCVKGVHTGQMVLRLVEAIDVYLAGTVMLIFGMGLYGLFISNVTPETPSDVDRALKGSSLFGMFALKERPKWMQISSLDELKTKVGHVIVMILLVKMFERSKMVTIATGMDLLCYSICIFLSSASLYILHNLHKSD
ncbi:uncharacterized protein LOC121979337 [Zingiber officinale]|uniref:Structural constituent of ribosome n=1 Tax=Zingiber officinale TaxID=94328 RepID=A0A8J5GCS9_ZINOF|nr:uncharacterized protein LOC121979337 [Zingiber officinale]KAG6506036.1 hypothetical protein ZIOFF_031351 [Zingiber officinale]